MEKRITIYESEVVPHSRIEVILTDDPALWVDPATEGVAGYLVTRYGILPEPVEKEYETLSEAVLAAWDLNVEEHRVLNDILTAADMMPAIRELLSIYGVRRCAVCHTWFSGTDNGLNADDRLCLDCNIKGLVPWQDKVGCFCGGEKNGEH